MPETEETACDAAVMNRLEPVKTGCPKCGTDLKYLGAVSADQLTLVAGALKGIRTVRVKQACEQCACIVDDPTPSRSIDGGISGPLVCWPGC
ncbi:MAG: hypothetical protein G5701_06050 [Serratia symbiotica]|nr:hypothetical protein [Serratia symbiotica]